MALNGPENPEVVRSEEAPKVSESAEAKLKEASDQPGNDLLRQNSDAKKGIDDLKNHIAQYPEGFVKGMLEQMADRVSTNPHDAFTRGLMALMLTMNQFRRGLTDISSGGYSGRIDEFGKHAEPEDRTKLLEVEAVPKELSEAAKAKLGRIEDSASARYAAYAVFGELKTPIDSGDELLSILRNDGDYNWADSEQQKGPFIFGTILTLKDNSRENSYITAYATGNGDEISYWDAESASLKTLRMGTLGDNLRVLGVLVKAPQITEEEAREKTVEMKREFEGLKAMDKEIKQQPANLAPYKYALSKYIDSARILGIQLSQNEKTDDWRKPFADALRKDTEEVLAMQKSLE